MTIDRQGGNTRRLFRLTLRGAECVLGERTWIVGVLNATPDSFSDGGRFRSPEEAVAHGLRLFADGADVLDIGGESTRPGAAAVGAADEIRRVVPLIARLREQGAGLLSVDTTKAEVAREAMDAGADIVNDVSGFRFDPGMAKLVADRGAAAVLMHLRGDFAGMHRQPRYDDVAAEVAAELRERAAEAGRAGVRPERILLDPGLGFSKDAGHSLEMLRRLSELAVLGYPILVGPSRKSFIGSVLDLPVGERLWGTAAAVAACVLGGAHLVRVHDVREMAQVARLCDAVVSSGARVAAAQPAEARP